MVSIIGTSKLLLAQLLTPCQRLAKSYFYNKYLHKMRHIATVLPLIDELIEELIMAPKKNYTPGQIAEAIRAVERGQSVASAAREYHIPRITLLYKVKGKYPKECSMGPPPTLTTEEEQILVQWILELSKIHYPISKIQLLDSVEFIIKETRRETKFKNGRPGLKWYKGFLGRHPEISERISQNLTVARESVKEQQIRDWFKEIKNYLISKNIFYITDHPNRVFNSDETAFFLQPKGEKVLSRKGEKNVYSAGGDEKENITVLVTANAAGQIAPPMVLFNYVRIPSYISSNVPKDWAIGTSENGWMCGPTFYEFVTNIFVPWLDQKQIQRPVLFFVDGHVSHMTLHLSTFCSKNGIELIALFPNSTHLLQPMDVGVFRPLKNAWKGEVKNWRMNNSGNKLQKQHFAQVLKKALEYISDETIANAFRASGLCPFNVENVKFEKISKYQSTKAQKKSAIATAIFLRALEERIGKEKLNTFRNFENNKWEGPIEDTSLFQIWKEASMENLEDKDDERKDYLREDEINEENNHSVGQSVSPSEGHITSDGNEQQIFKSPEPSTSKNTDNELQTPDKTANALPLDVPSPFKRALFWPDITPKTKKRKSKEKIPSVVTCEAWQIYHKKKEMEKNRKIEDKQKRALLREQKKSEQLRKKNKRNDSESSSEEEWQESGDSLDDVELFEELQPDFCIVDAVKDIHVGDYLLVKFVGGKRKTVNYRYACIVQNVYEDENEVEIMCLKSLNKEKTQFKMDENDISTINKSSIVGKLPTPEIVTSGDRIKYKFSEPIDVFEA